MNSIFRLCISVFAIIIASSTFGQKYKEIAYDYMRVEEELGNDVEFSKANVHKFSNGNVVVDLYVTKNYTLREEFTVPNGGVINYMDGNGQIKSTNKAYKDHKESATWSYKVFISKSGEPLKYLSPKGGYEVKYLPNSVWVFEHGRSKKVGDKWLSNFDDIKCYSSEGTPIEEKNDLVFYSIAETPNYMYLVGEINSPNGSRSLVRTVNRKTNSYKDKLGELGEIDYSLEFVDKGISITKHRSSGKPTKYIIPYETEDKDFQIQQVMKGYDLNQPSGQVVLGEHYLKGDVLGKDTKKAFELFEKAASKNDEKGLYKLAECYLNGWGVTQNASSAITYYEKCANLGNKEAISTLSDMYLNGKFIDKDMSKVLYWKERLALLDDKDAQKFVIENASTEYTHALTKFIDALELARKNVKSANYPWAKFCYERAVSLGSKDAAFELGKWLYEGNGIAKDCNKAIEYLSKIGEKSNLEAQKLLVVMYKENKGVTPDLEKEMYWVTKAADNNDVESVLILAQAYEFGNKGLKKNKKLSFAMYEKAANLRNEDALERVFLGYALGKGTKKDLDKAQQYFYKMSPELRQQIASDLLCGSLTIKKNKKLGEYFIERLY